MQPMEEAVTMHSIAPRGTVLTAAAAASGEQALPCFPAAPKCTNTDRVADVGTVLARTWCGNVWLLSECAAHF